MTSQAQSPTPAVSPLMRLLLEGGPLLSFFIANRLRGIYVGTAVFMVAVLLALAISWRVERRLPVMPVVTAVFVLIFGGLTLYLGDDLFIKLKPTIVNCIFATTLFAGLLGKRLLLKHLLGTSIAMGDAGWISLTKRWAWFFLFLAALNELVWRSFSTDTWVSFKTFGILPLSMAFMLCQLGLIQRHGVPQPSAPTRAGNNEDKP